MTSLEHLKRAGKGIYCGPLRLLAHEIHKKLEDQNIPCSLQTGQERIIRQNSRIYSCTIEIADLETIYDVAVIVINSLIEG